MYVAYTAPHWPLHAHEEDIARYKGRFDAGWDALREERLDRLVKAGIIHPSWQLTDRDPTQPPWTEAERRDWLLRCMEVYAAQIDRMDQGIGRILAALEETGQLDNTLVLFLSDNGACAEDIPTGVTARELVDELMIAKATTRRGEPVRFGNDPDIVPGERTRTRATGRPGPTSRTRRSGSTSTGSTRAELRPRSSPTGARHQGGRRATPQSRAAAGHHGRRSWR
jgi:arylsulfatase